MRIAVLNWRDCGNPAAGGAEVFVHEVTRRWAVEHDVRVFSSRVAHQAPLDVDEKVVVERVGRLEWGTHHLLAPYRAARSFAPDVIFESVNTLPYLLPVRRLGCPTVTLVHQVALDVWDHHFSPLWAALGRSLERALLKPYGTREVLAVSESTARDLRALGHRARVIPQGGLGPQPSRPPKESDPTLLFVGRLTSGKRPSDALEAFELVRSRSPRARLWMVGEGPMRVPLERSAPPGTEFFGRLERARLLELMGRAHVLISTSVREGWGLVVTEANAMGTPCVGYDVPGLRDSIRDGVTGLLCAEIPASLGNCVVGLFEEPERYASLSAEATVWGEQHTWEKTADSLMTHLGAGGQSATDRLLSEGIDSAVLRSERPRMRGRSNMVRS